MQIIKIYFHICGWCNDDDTYSNINIYNECPVELSLFNTFFFIIGLYRKRSRHELRTELYEKLCVL